MRKEIIFAIVFGAAIGLVVAFGIWRANGALRSKEPLDQQITASATPQQQQQNATPTPPTSSQLTIQRPLNFDVSVNPTITLAGITKANSNVVVYSESYDYFYKTDDTGAFELDIDLRGGINSLLIASNSTEGQTYQTSLDLVFTTELDINPQNTPTPSSDDPVRQKLQEKLDEVSNRRTSIIGVVTDKTEAGIQVKNGNSEIKQVNITSQTTYVQSKGAAKEVKFDDLAIGDYIAAVGYMDANNLLSAQRVIVTYVTDTKKRRIIYGKVKSFSKAQIEVESEGQTYEVPSGRNLKIYSADSEGSSVATTTFSKIAEGDFVSLTGELEDNKLTPRSIYIITPAQ